MIEFSGFGVTSKWCPILSSWHAVNLLSWLYFYLPVINVSTLCYLRIVQPANYRVLSLVIEIWTRHDTGHSCGQACNWPNYPFRIQLCYYFTQSSRVIASFMWAFISKRFVIGSPCARVSTQPCLQDKMSPSSDCFSFLITIDYWILYCVKFMPALLRVRMNKCLFDC